MKTDSLIYKFFQLLPQAVFALLGAEPPGSPYAFTSLELKGHSLRLDGVLLPESPEETVYFVEAQFRKDKTLYPRLFAEIMLYLHQYKRHGEETKWQALALFPHCAADAGLPGQYHAFEAHGQLRRIYLSDLREQETTPFPLSILRLIEEPLLREDIPRRIEPIIDEAERYFPSEDDHEPILQIVLNILLEKFPDLSRKELEAMMYTPTSKFFASRFYREIREEALNEGIEKGIEKGIEQGIEKGIEKGESQAIARLAMQWSEQGRSEREIAALLNISPQEVQRLLKR